MAPKKSIKLSVSGANGRMGQAVIKIASAQKDITIVEAIDRAPSDSANYFSVVTAHKGGADVMIDFSTPEGFRARLNECVKHKTGFVTGTTGLSDADFKLLDKAAKSIPVLHAGNFSTGVALLCELVKQAAKIVPNYDIEIVEMHHNQKVDAPSGTANMLLGAACEALGRNAKKDVRHGREGHTGKRTAKEIGMHALRGGDVFGDHTVIFAGTGERIELTHKASSRDTFATGAIMAARFLVGKKKGRYTIRDVLLG